MASRIAVINKGILQQIDTPQTLYDRPDNLFVAGFIGSPAMNFFNAELSGAAEKLFLQTGAVRIELPPEKYSHLSGYKEKSVTVGIRPEDLKYTPVHVDGKTIQGTVEVVEPIGNETYIELNAGNFNLFAAVGRKSQIKPHSNFILMPIIDNLHLFEADSEKAIF